MTLMITLIISLIHILTYICTIVQYLAEICITFLQNLKWHDTIFVKNIGTLFT